MPFIQSLRDNKANVEVIITNSGDVMEDEGLRTALELLECDDRVMKIKLNEHQENARRPSFTVTVDPVEEEEFVELSFKTKGEDVETYSHELIDRIFSIPGFKVKVHDHIVKFKNATTSKIQFILRQSAEAAMDDPAIKIALNLLQNEERVKKINMKVAQLENLKAMKENTPSAIKSAIKKQMTRTSSILISFNVKGTREYANELTTELMRINGFESKLHQKKISAIRENKVKCAFAMYDEGHEDPEDDPVIREALELLHNDDKVYKLKTNKIPYFVQ